MSRNEWEHGEIKLPTDQVVMVKDAVKDAVVQYNDRLYADSQAFWKALPAGHKRDPKKYSVAVRAFVHGNQDEQYNRTTEKWEKMPLDAKLPTWRGIGKDDDWGRNTYADDLENLLGYRCTSRVVKREIRGVTVNQWEQVPPRRAQRPDVESVVGKPTGANPSFTLGESHLSFKGRVAVWDVAENNHACEYGRNHPVARVFFQVLGRVRWTRGSGGEIVGNDEYNQDSRDSGGGGNYTTSEYGPPKAPRRRQPMGARR